MIRTPQTSKKSFMVGIDITNSRLKREQETISIRKKQRDNQLSKRRGIIEENTIPQIENINIQDIYSDDTKLVFDVLNFIRKQLVFDNPPIKEIISMDIIPRIIDLLKMYSNPDIQVQCAWIITNITASNFDYMDHIYPSINLLAQLFLISQHDEVREQCLWALGNIIADHDISDVIDSSNLVSFVSLQILKTKKISFMRTGSWVICNVLRIEKYTSYENIVNILKATRRMLNVNDEETLDNSLYILSIISNVVSYHNLLIECGFIPVLVSFLSAKKDLSIKSTKVLGNLITSEEDEIIQNIIDCGFLIKLKELFFTFKEYRREYCWIISNMAAGCRDHISLVVDLFLDIIYENISELNMETKQEIVWLIYNIILKNREFIPRILKFLDFIFEMMKKDHETRYKSLEILFFISSSEFKNENILNNVEDILYKFDNQQIFTLSNKIIDIYKTDF